MADEYTSGSEIPSDFPVYRDMPKPVKSTVYLTQAQYDELDVKDDDILYVITE